jgi:uncharacterized membrane protein
MSEKGEHARLEAFCDAVFAIAITLLILEIKIPPAGSLRTTREFWGRLLEDWPSWFGFSLSFVIILVAWVNHHNIFKVIGKSSPQFTFANGFMLFTVVVLPFSTGLMSEYLTTDLAQPAITVYCFSILMHNVAWIFFEWAAMHPSLFRDPASHDMFAKVVYKSSRIAFLFYLSLCVLSFWFPHIAMLIMTISWVYWIFTAIVMNPKQSEGER